MKRSVAETEVDITGDLLQQMRIDALATAGEQVSKLAVQDMNVAQQDLMEHGLEDCFARGVAVAQVQEILTILVRIVTRKPGGSAPSESAEEVMALLESFRHEDLQAHTFTAMQV